nr:RNA-directed DNA polymerase [Tanacetum cinerariifolium]
MAMIVNSRTTIDPVTGKEAKGKERMVFNYKSLNGNTYKDQYSLPGEEFSDDEVTPGKVTILNGSKEESDWDDDERSGGKNLVIQEKLAQNQQDFLDVTPPKFNNAAEYYFGVLLHSPYAQVTENEFKRDVLQNVIFDILKSEFTKVPSGSAKTT